jgi:hypothetical protein
VFNLPTPSEVVSNESPRRGDPEGTTHTDAFLDLTYTRDLLMIEIAFIEGRSDELKKALLADLNRRLVETADLRADDVFVSMYELAAANVSFGRGLAQRAP